VPAAAAVTPVHSFDLTVFDSNANPDLGTDQHCLHQAKKGKCARLSRAPFRCTYAIGNVWITTTCITEYSERKSCGSRPRRGCTKSIGESADVGSGTRPGTAGDRDESTAVLDAL
jgi:hypothetical protein